MSAKGGERLPSVGIVGAGRAGSALAVALHLAGCEVSAVHSRTAAHAEQVARAVESAVAETPIDVMLAADVTLLTVPDPAIHQVAATVAASGATLHGRAAVHCSARLGPDAASDLTASGAAVGVLHPLQAMAGPASAPSLRGAHFRVEAEGELEPVLQRLVGALDGHVLRIEPAQRDLYHAAAVLAGNAPLALLARASELLRACGVDPATAHRALSTLLEGAAANARREAPEAALTGPVVRGDHDAIAAHLEALAAYPEARDLYAVLLREMERLVAARHADGTRPALHRVA